MSSAKLLRFNMWANRLITDQVQSFPNELFDKHVGGSFGTLKGVINHLLDSDFLWLNRWKGIPLADIPAWKRDTLPEIVKIWSPMQDEMVSIAEALENEPTKPINFITRKGIPYTMPFEDIAIHVANHGTYHRGQLTNMIRDLGQNPVSTDYFIFCNQ
jgi:uncharacterized damage-inducible protein DinB